MVLLPLYFFNIINIINKQINLKVFEMKMSKFDELYNLVMEDTKATNNTDETKKAIVQEMQDLDWDYKSDEEKLKTQVFY